MYMRAAQLQVCELLGWDEVKYNQYMLECGLKWLSATLESESGVVRQAQDDTISQVQAVSYDKRFWSWWKIMWYTRESAWLMEVNHRTYMARERSKQMIGVTELGNTPEERVLSACFGNYGNKHQKITLDVAPTPADWEKKYKDIHNPHVLAEAITLEGKLLEDSYCNTLIPMLNGGR